MESHRISMLGTGLIGDFYTATLHGQRGRDRVQVVYSRTEDRGRAFRERWDIPESTTDIKAAVEHPDTDVVVIGVPNFMHEEAVGLAAAAGKAVLCTKPLGRTAAEAKRMLDAVESAGVFAGYLEDLVYTPKTLKAVTAVEGGAIGAVTWVRSRETHPGPHSAWFWDGRLTGGGAIIDLGCHCIEIIRNFVGKGNRPVEVMCHTDTLVHPISDEDNAIALIRFESGAIGQFEVSWTFRGGMDLRDEVAGTHGTIWLNHFLRTGFEMFTAGGGTSVHLSEYNNETSQLTKWHVPRAHYLESWGDARTWDGTITMAQPLAHQDAVVREMQMGLGLPILLVIPAAFAAIAFAVRQSTQPFRVFREQLETRSEKDLAPVASGEAAAGAGSDQPPSATSWRASSGPQLPWSYSYSGVTSSPMTGSTTRHSASTASWRANSSVSPCMASPSSRS